MRLPCDEHFIPGHDPAHPQVMLASPCSGHGCKFRPVIGPVTGEVLADPATSNGTTQHDIGPLQVHRPALAHVPASVSARAAE